jgi:hypothetical protein
MAQAQVGALSTQQMPAATTEWPPRDFGFKLTRDTQENVAVKKQPPLER